MISRAARHLFGMIFPRADTPTYQDRALAHRLCATFEEKTPIRSIDNVHFYVLNGSVTVLGRAENKWEREFFISFLEEMPGVRRVVDSMHPRHEAVHTRPVRKRTRFDPKNVDIPLHQISTSHHIPG